MTPRPNPIVRWAEALYRAYALHVPDPGSLTWEEGCLPASGDTLVVTDGILSAAVSYPVFRGQVDPLLMRVAYALGGCSVRPNLAGFSYIAPKRVYGPMDTFIDVLEQGVATWQDYVPSAERGGWVDYLGFSRGCVLTACGLQPVVSVPLGARISESIRRVTLIQPGLFVAPEQITALDEGRALGTSPMLEELRSFGSEIASSFFDTLVALADAGVDVSVAVWDGDPLLDFPATFRDGLTALRAVGAEIVELDLVPNPKSNAFIEHMRVLEELLLNGYVRKRVCEP